MSEEVDKEVCNEKHKNIDNILETQSTNIKAINETIQKLEKKLMYFGFVLLLLSKIEISSTLSVIKMAMAAIGK